MANQVSSDMLTMAFKQLDATDIETINTKTILVNFTLENDTEVTYMCSAHEEGEIYLQRVLPYPIRQIKFGNTLDILKFINKDMKLFKNASKSSNFPLFLEIIEKNYDIRANIERLFLEHNVDHDFLTEVLNELNQVTIEINEENEESEILDEIEEAIENIENIEI